ncbi:diphthamide biosynthesis protein 3 isoform 1-T1 [Anomaloglossus baeobatrachus]|uniref:diphthamide biosynthesis protein 3 n=1 Tax=Anomaloglossus baeobatrachus TaxID=238106 RepID=UPI003F502F9A
MAVYHDEVEIEDFEYDEDTDTYYYPCPCGDRFAITKEDLENGEEVATCPTCSLLVRVIYDKDKIISRVNLYDYKMSKTFPMKSAVFEHFTVTQDEKYFVCLCMTSDPDENKCCDAKISAYSGSDKNAPTRASTLKRHLQRFHPEVFKAVTEKDNSSTKKPVPSTSCKTKEEERASQTSLTRYFDEFMKGEVVQPASNSNELLKC